MTPNAEKDAPAWLTEWAVEVTWRDWKKAGAKGPTSQFGPFSTPESRDAFLDQQRRDRDIAATRVLTRRAAYTPWDSTDQPEPTSEADRDLRLARYYDRMGLSLHTRVIPPGPGHLSTHINDAYSGDM